MSELNHLHREAMQHADAADRARRQGDSRPASEELRQAFDLERQAAALIAGDLSAEPTRSVLHRSAAALALEFGAYREGERLIAAALAGNPPEEIAQELRDLLEQVNFEHHLALRGITLERQVVQVVTNPGPASHGT
jgi:hypothetical protein